VCVCVYVAPPGHAASRNPTIICWSCRLTQIDLYSGHKATVCLCVIDRFLCQQTAGTFGFVTLLHNFFAKSTCWLSYVTENKTKNRRSWELLLTLLFDWHNRLYLERGADLHIAQLMPLSLTVSYFCKIQIGFTSLVLAYPGKRLLNVCMCNRLKPVVMRRL